MVAHISDMDKTHEDLYEECVIIASLMYEIATGKSKEELEEAVKEVLENGKALEKFKELITIQGGDVADIHLNETKYVADVRALTSGTVEKGNALLIGKVSLALGAGRLTKESELGYDAGVALVGKKGMEVIQGDVVAKLYSNKEITEAVIKKAEQAFVIK